MKDYVVAIGGIGVDEYIQVDSWPELSDKAVCTRISTELGGMISNFACNISTTGVKSYILHQLADDEYLDMFKNEFDRYKVDYSYCVVSNEIETTKCIVANTNGERTILVILGKATQFALDRKTVDLLSNAKYVFSTIPNFKNLVDDKEIIKIITNNGAKIILDVEATTFRETDDLDFYFEHAGVLIFNEFGFEKYNQRYGRSPSELVKQGKIIVVTKGASGADVFTQNGSHSVEGHKINVVDTTGAGDMFSSTFISELIKGTDEFKATELANLKAAEHTTYLGPKRRI